MGRALGIWVAATLIGFVLIVSLPERPGSGMFFRLSDRHGPSAEDAVGLAVALAGWFIYVRALWLRRGRVRRPQIAAALSAVATVATLGCVVSATANEDWLIAGSAVIAIAAHLGLGILVRSEA
jgi:predicted branched-subunit amino acid permease